MVGFHGSKAAEVLGEHATARGKGHAAAAYQQFFQPSDLQPPSAAMQWGSSHEVCGKLTLMSDLPQSAQLAECGFQATPAVALHGLLPRGVLGASPDGVVWDFGSLTAMAKAVEIKCPFPSRTMTSMASGLTTWTSVSQ
ncbi:hypothetical protein DUNSADRAFT_11058 [Dunaliella salina]|uniref:YqaJ viral recombinase domain-containing protein n=1 Tax=Dunaliella salina TaxID=3046 RepID=A0ABQ7FS53_DUNSA|nr:hypothetical protein DUNSADRAFT_11058 [Dunaliella salina]|eukprot:KAF5825374.1 hypothetical protein DUNSADRAFT_11058 [Dunaliella salina]